MDSDDPGVEESMSLFPIFVKLEGRPVLLVGAGPVGESKVGGLLSAGAVGDGRRAGGHAGDSEARRRRQVVWHQSRVRAGRSRRHGAGRRGRAEGHRASGLSRSADRAAFSSTPSTIPTTAISTIRPSSIAAICRSRFRPRDTARRSRSASASSSSSSSARSTRSGFSSWATRGAICSRPTWIRRRGSRSCTRWPPSPRAGRHDRRRTGMVYLVGAGPGDPELLTLKALRILGQADVVLHDDLLTPEILELIPSTARVECVGKRHNERQVTQQEINRRLCDYGAAGQTVVRLKGGDGAIFGRASEEMDALRAAGISVRDRARRDRRERRRRCGRRVADRSPAGIGARLSDRAALQRQSAAELEGGRRARRHHRHLHARRSRGRSRAASLSTPAWPPRRPASWSRARRGRTSRSSKPRLASCRTCRQLPAPAILLIGAVAGQAHSRRSRRDRRKCWQNSD